MQAAARIWASESVATHTHHVRWSAWQRVTGRACRGECKAQRSLAIVVVRMSPARDGGAQQPQLAPCPWCADKLTCRSPNLQSGPRSTGVASGTASPLCTQPHLSAARRRARQRRTRSCCKHCDSQTCLDDSAGSRRSIVSAGAPCSVESTASAAQKCISCGLTGAQLCRVLQGALYATGSLPHRLIISLDGWQVKRGIVARAQKLVAEAGVHTALAATMPSRCHSTAASVLQQTCGAVYVSPNNTVVPRRRQADSGAA